MLAIKLGVRDLNDLIRWQGMGFIGVPLGLWLIAMLLQLRTYFFWFFLLGFSVAYLRSGFFAAGEYNLANALLVVSFSLLMCKSLRLTHAIALILCAFVLLRTYESTILFSLFLLVVVTSRLYLQSNDRYSVKLSLAISAGLYFFGLIIALYSMLFQREYSLTSTTNTKAFLEWPLLYLEVLCGLFCLAWFNLRKPVATVAYLVAIGVSILYFLYVIRWDRTNLSFAFLSYAYRPHSALMLVSLLFVAWGIQLLNRTSIVTKKNIGLLCIVATCSLSTLGAQVLFHTNGYYQWLKRFESEALRVTQTVHIDHTIINPSNNWIGGYNWPWSNAMLSILLRGNAVGIILNPSNYSGWENIDPGAVDFYPLSRYQKNNLF